MLESLSKIKETERPPLVIVSDFSNPGENQYLSDLATQLKVSVSFRWLVSDDELIRLYNEAKLTVYTPIMEPFGFVPIESMACGTPVVAICEGGVRETVLHEETGLLIERDPVLFAEAIKSLCNDPERCHCYADQGRAYVQERWSWDSSLHNLERHLARTVEDHR